MSRDDPSMRSVAFMMIVVGVARGACAQPADCVAEPIGPAMPMEVWSGIDGRPGLPKPSAPAGSPPTAARNVARLDLAAEPMFGTVCDDQRRPPADVLHGDPAPRGLLQGDGPHDPLHNRYHPRVTIEPPR